VTYGFYLSYYSGVAVSERYIENHTGGNTLATVRTAASADTSILSDDQTDATYSSTVDDTNFTGFPSDGSPSNCDGSVYVPGELLSRTCAAHDETDGVAPSCTPTLVFDGPCDNGVGPYSFSHTTTAAEHAHRVKYLHKRGTNDRGRLWDSSLVIPHGSVTGAYFGEMRENTDSVGSSEQTTSNCSDAAWAAWAGGAGGVTCAVNVSREDYAVWCYQQAACTGPDPGDVYKVQVYRMDCPGALTWPTDDPSLFGFNGYGSDQVRLDTTVSATASRQTKDMNFSLTLNGVATQVAVLNGKVTTSSSNAGNLGTYVPACQPYFPSIDTSGNDPYTGQYPVGTDHICRLFASAGGVDVHQVSMLPAPTVFDSTDLNFGSYDNSAAHSGSFIPSFVGFA
jgi:hypothetical protein